MRSLGIALAGLLLTHASLAAEKAPKKPDVAKLLRTAKVPVKEVTDVLADLGGGRYPVLFFTRGEKACNRRMIDGQPDEVCSTTTEPWVAIVTRGPDGALAVEATLALPTADKPWDEPGPELGWGITNVKDVDGDGKPELTILYGYNGNNAWAVGFTHYRDLCILNLDKLAIGLHLEVDAQPQASVYDRFETTWQLDSDKRVLTATRTTRRGSDPVGEPRVEVITYAWSPDSDAWTERERVRPGR
jgi:hypothetical protein